MAESKREAWVGGWAEQQGSAQGDPWSWRQPLMRGGMSAMYSPYGAMRAIVAVCKKKRFYTGKPEGKGDC